MFWESWGTSKPKRNGITTKGNSGVVALPPIHPKTERGADYEQARPTRYSEPPSFLPPTRHAGGLVASEGGRTGPQSHYTYYHHDGRGYRAGHDSKPKSMPPARKNEEDAKLRLANSAPSKKSPRGPLPRINNLVTRGKVQASSVPITMTQGHAGLSSGSQDTSLNSNRKFATTWARARAKNSMALRENNETPSSKTDGVKDSQHSKPSPGHAHSVERSLPVLRNKDLNNIPVQSHRKSLEVRKGKENAEVVSEAHSPTKLKIQSRDNAVIGTTVHGSESQKANGALESTKVSDQDAATKEETRNEISDSAFETKRTEKEMRDPDKENKAPSKSQVKSVKLSYQYQTKPPADEDKNKQTQKAKITRDTDASSVESEGDAPSKASRPKSLISEKERKDDEECTHQPILSDYRTVTTIYTGASTVREAMRPLHGQRTQKVHPSGTYKLKTKLPPWHRKDVVLNRREAAKYRQIHAVYDNNTFKQQRQERFYDQLEEAQQQEMKLQSQERKEQERQKREAIRKQQLQLKRVRGKFQSDLFRRFKSEYVTFRDLEHEKMNRHAYGLPEEFGESPDSSITRKKKKVVPPEKLDKESLREKNKKIYGKLFKIKVGPGWNPGVKPPKMEGIDTVIIEETDAEGNVIEKKKDLKSIVKDVKAVLEEDTLKDALLTPPESRMHSRSPSLRVRSDRSALSSLDLNDDESEDIFEQARRKYNLDVSDDEDDTKTWT